MCIKFWLEKWRISKCILFIMRVVTFLLYLLQRLKKYAKPIIKTAFMHCYTSLVITTIKYLFILNFLTFILFWCSQTIYYKRWLIQRLSSFLCNLIQKGRKIKWTLFWNSVGTTALKLRKNLIKLWRNCYS